MSFCISPQAVKILFRQTQSQVRCCVDAPVKQLIVCPSDSHRSWGTWRRSAISNGERASLRRLNNTCVRRTSCNVSVGFMGFHEGLRLCLRICGGCSPACAAVCVLWSAARWSVCVFCSQITRPMDLAKGETRGEACRTRAGLLPIGMWRAMKGDCFCVSGHF